MHVTIYKLFVIFLDYVWFPENTKERKKNVKKNGFFMFGFTMEKANIIKIN